jgi:hypothetical protein
MLVADQILQLAEAASGPTRELARVASFLEHKSSGSGSASPFPERGEDEERRRYCGEPHPPNHRPSSTTQLQTSKNQIAIKKTVDRGMEM